MGSFYLMAHPLGGFLTTIRPMTCQDYPAMAALCREMQAYHNGTCPSEEEVVARLSNLPEGVAILVAEATGIVGLASCAAIFPGPGLEAGLFLKELFVSAGARGHGVGSALMKAVAALAIGRGFTRIDWTADRFDTSLLSFYNRIGGTELGDRVFIRLTGDALSRLAMDGQIGDEG